MTSGLGDDLRLLAMDSRGHGLSDKPHDAYSDSELWADDIHTVVDALGLDDLILVGWSYAGLIVFDYIEKYGSERLAGVNLVGAVSKIGTEEATALLGSAYLDLMPGLTSTDVEESVAALQTFIRYCRCTEPSQEELYYTLGYNVIVPPHVRDAMRSRTVSHDAVLRSLDIPVLLTHGMEDRIVKPETAEKHADLISNAQTSFYPAAGHSLFLEAPTRYNRELREFVLDT